MKPPTLPFFALAILLVLGTGCGSAPLYQTDDDDTAGPLGDDDIGSDEATWAQVQELLASECGRCHTTRIRAELTSLDEYDEGYAMLVGRPSEQLPGMMLVSPGEPESSYLMHKLLGTQLEIGGRADSMPPEERDPLTDEDIALVEEWIRAGALKN